MKEADRAVGALVQALGNPEQQVDPDEAPEPISGQEREYLCLMAHIPPDVRQHVVRVMEALAGD